jgi:hypothetical protein
MVEVRKRELECEALKYTGNNMVEVREFCGTFCMISPATGHLGVMTEVGVRTVEEGSWIVRGPRGFFPIEHDRFIQYYEVTGSNLEEGMRLISTAIGKLGDDCPQALLDALNELEIMSE